MKSKSKKSIINFSTAIIYKLVVIVVGLLLPRLFITSYGSEVNGLQSSVRQIFTYIALLEAGVGASTLQSLYKPVATGDRSTTNSYLSAASSYYNRIGILYFVSLAVLGIVYSLFVEVEAISSIEVFCYIVVSGALTGINFFYLAKLKLIISAEGDQYVVSVITMVSYIVSSFIKICLIYIGVNIILVELSFFGINMIATGVYFLVAKRKYPWLSFRAKPDFSCTEQKGSVMIHRVASVVFQNVDVVLLTIFCDLKTVSIYSMYKMVVNMVTSVVSEVGVSVNFIFGQQFNSETDENKPRYCNMIDVFNVYYSAISFGLYTVTYILILPFLKIYTDGMDMNYIFPLLPLVYIIMEFLMVGREAMMRTIEVAGHFKKTRAQTVTETVINMGASVILLLVLKSFMGNIGGIYGVLIGTIVALLYRTIEMNIYANKRILHRNSFKTFSVMLINAVLFAVVAVIFSKISLPIDDYFSFILHGCWISVVIVAFYMIVQSVVNPKEFVYILKYLKTKMKRVK